jgi:preprotein translocase subunit SecY
MQQVNFNNFSQIKGQLYVVLAGILFFRLGSYIPVPGLDPEKLSQMLNINNSIFGLFNMFSGGALSRLSIFFLGIMPYISASIIIQLLTPSTPSLNQLKKEGARGKTKLNRITKYLTLLIATVQSYGFSQTLVASNISYLDSTFFTVSTMLTLITGSMLLMWLGEKITDFGIGNGTSIIIFSGIVAGLPNAFFSTLEQVRNNQINILYLFAFLLVIIFLIFVIIFAERALRKIPITYAKRQQGAKLYGEQKTTLPLKINMAGVIPPIFASSVILLPITLIQILNKYYNNVFLDEVVLLFGHGKPIYMIVFTALVIFFSFFYTALIYNPEETASNLKKDNAFITGIRPGKNTERYIDVITTKLTLIGGIYISLVCLVPDLLVSVSGIPFYFGGTSMLIVVVVILDFITQVQARLMSYQYGSILRKKR